MIPIIIPYFKAPQALKKCLLAIQAQSNVITEIFIRDNSDDNILFTRAVNEGLRKYLLNPSIKYLLVLNQDAYLQQGCLKKLCQLLDKNPKAGIAIPVAVDEKGMAVSFAALDAYPWGVSRGGDRSIVPKTPFATYWANGACMLLRKEMIHQIGLMDENMRFICSDSDYSFTARARGWDVLVEPDALIEHQLNASGNVSTSHIEEIKLQDQLYFSRKWLSGDLYRSLAYEGSKLTSKDIEDEINKTKYLLEKVRQLNGSA